MRLPSGKSPTRLAASSVGVSGELPPANTHDRGRNEGGRVSANRKGEHLTASSCSLEPAHRLGLGVERVDGRRAHTDMEIWTEIGRKSFLDNASKRSIRRDCRSVLGPWKGPEPPGYRQR